MVTWMTKKMTRVMQMNQLIRVLFDVGHAQNTWPPSKGINLPNGKSFAEHTFNFLVAMAAKVLAEYNGFEIVFSQEDYKKDIGLIARVKRIIQMHKLSPFLCLFSFHANASSNPKAKGHGVFHYFNSKLAKKLAEIWDKYADQLLPNPDWGKTGVWQSFREGWTRMYILLATPMPAILLEHFFFTNMEELEQCNTPEYINLCAETLVRTLCEYAGKEFKPLPDEEEVIELTDDEKLLNITKAVEAAANDETIEIVEIFDILIAAQRKLFEKRE